MVGGADPDHTGVARADGTVEAELHGSVQAVANVVETMRRGPTYGRVDEVTSQDIPDATVDGFDIRPTA